MQLPQQKPMSPWMEKTMLRQLSQERDFQRDTPITFQYGILCGHRMGSNLLCESLYETGMAGDPMEFFNARFLQRLCQSRNIPGITYADYMKEMKSRRTSPNGVFGFNIKFDQYAKYFQRNLQDGMQMIKGCDYIVFLYRKDKISQAVSQYIGFQRDTFRIPAEADKKQIEELVSTVPFNAAIIATMLDDIIKQEQAWIKFMHVNNIAHDTLAYEDMVDDYEGTIARILGKIGVPKDEQSIPSIPTMKVSTPKNKELKEKFMATITGAQSLEELLPHELLQPNQAA